MLGSTSYTSSWLLQSACRAVSYVRRRNLTQGLSRNGLLENFAFYPDVFDGVEQRLLLSAALHKLDAVENRQFRQRRKDYVANNHGMHSHVLPQSVQGLFLPDGYYDFEEGHYDGVIKHFREMHVSTWPDLPGLEPLLDRLRGLHPQEPTQTHILHLASDGEILPHVDNIEASGSWILGVSLGAARTMRLQNMQDAQDALDIALPSGSVYLQKDSTRYGYEHSILKGGGGQRLSIMIRVSESVQNIRMLMDRFASESPMTPMSM